MAQPSGRGQTPYFLFAQEQRDSARGALLDAAGPSAKVSAAEVAKQLGAQWRALTDEQKEVYKAKATRSNKENLAKAAAKESGKQALDTAPTSEPVAEEQPPEKADKACTFPLSLIKRIMGLDPEVSRMTSDAVRATASATLVFLELLTARAFKEASLHKRRTVRLADVETVVNRDRRLTDMGLPTVIAEVVDAAFDEEGRPEAREDKGHKPAEGNHKITDLFRAA